MEFDGFGWILMELDGVARILMDFRGCFISSRIGNLCVSSGIGHKPCFYYGGNLD